MSEQTFSVLQEIRESALRRYEMTGKRPTRVRIGRARAKGLAVEVLDVVRAEVGGPKPEAGDIKRMYRQILKGELAIDGHAIAVDLNRKNIYFP